MSRSGGCLNAFIISTQRLSRSSSQCATEIFYELSERTAFRSGCKPGVGIKILSQLGGCADPSTPDAAQNRKVLKTKKIACVTAKAMEVVGEVSTIARMMRTGTSIQTRSIDMTSTILSFLIPVLPTVADASFVMVCPIMTADTIDHSGMERIVRSCPRCASVIAITTNGSKTNKSSDVAFEKAPSYGFFFSFWTWF